MSLSPNDKYNQGINPTSKRLREGANSGDYDERACKISRTTSSFIPNLSGDYLNIIFNCLQTREDRNSFGLTCRQWFHIQNNNHETLWFRNNYDPSKYPKVSPESLARVICKLLIRFQRLKCLFPERLPGITNIVFHMLAELHLSLSPCLTFISLSSSDITDKGLEALAKCCSSLEMVDLSRCCSVTDSGISCLLQNCRKLGSLDITYCSGVTGIGFQECAQTLNRLAAGGCIFEQEGITAIVSRGGLKYLCLKTPNESAKVEQGCINIEILITISKGCPLLKNLLLSNCEEVKLKGWEAIGRNCKELETLFVMGCQRLCDMGLQAICDGCNKLSELYIDEEKNSCSYSALELFERKKPGVICLWP
ncbi:hypothetical protein MKW94_014068 [Papaver nudicaule]|uniref:F-box/LRR-repeat protein 15-like leucin rich repeat domain-containing protein n=1 Tax=Papaver nudicaule TaxID=74823 RepID=A0AA42B4Y0_PAPNU|nr:hypothetical protein [Papaver nudicaule]